MPCEDAKGLLPGRAPLGRGAGRSPPGLGAAGRLASDAGASDAWSFGPSCSGAGAAFSSAGVPFYFGGTALLIAVGVGLDTIAQVESHLVSRQYEGFVKGGRIRGRIGR